MGAGKPDGTSDPRPRRRPTARPHAPPEAHRPHPSAAVGQGPRGVCHRRGRIRRQGGTTFGEPSIAVNPADPNQIAVTRFPSAAAEWNNPADLLYSTDGGITWADEPTIPVPPGLGTATNNCPCDQTIDYGRDGTLYGAFLTNASQVVTGSTADPTKPSSWSWNTTAGTTQLTNATNTNADQPWLLVNRDPDHADQDSVYVGYEDLGTSTRPAQAHVAVSRNARPPDFTRDNSPGAVVTDTNTSGGIRLATDPRNGTIYALFQTQTTAGPSAIRRTSPTGSIDRPTAGRPGRWAATRRASPSPRRTPTRASRTSSARSTHFWVVSTMSPSTRPTAMCTWPMAWTSRATTRSGCVGSRTTARAASPSERSTPSPTRPTPRFPRSRCSVTGRSVSST